MAQITWKHPKPAPDPFASVVGDATKYAVHLCEARAHKNEESEILASVLESALATAGETKIPEARLVLFTFDAVYATLTIVVTDAERAHDEHEVFKLIFHDWDRDMQERHVADSEFDKLCEELEHRMYSLMNSVLRQERFAVCIERLKASGFEFWFAGANPEENWKRLDV